VRALRQNPRVALTIDTQGEWPPRVLLVRGAARLELVDGVPDAYVEASRKLVPAEHFAGWEQGVRALYDRMVVITVEPDWAKLLDIHMLALLGGRQRTRQEYAALLGQAGFQALLARALTLATAEFPWLAAGGVAERDGSLKGLRAAAEGRELAQAGAGFVAVLGHILGLLVVFIGGDLTGRLVRQVWPEADLGDPAPDSEDEAKRQR